MVRRQSDAGVIAESAGGLLARRTITKGLALSAAGLFVSGTEAARAAIDVIVRLPRPTGPCRVGVTVLDLVDHARRDPWDDRVPVREVMVSVFYPAQSVHDRSPAPQMTPGAAQAFTSFAPFQYGLPADGVNWAATLTNSYQDAPAQTVPRPVVLYSPGGADPRSLGTSVAEELASHGFVVVTVDHPGDANAVEFPGTTDYRDDVVRQTVFRADPRTDPALFDSMIEARIADLRFVLDAVHTLADGANPDASGSALPESLGSAIDLRRVGVYGHSAGGTAAAQTMYDDPRFGVAINLEGYLDQPPSRVGAENELFPVAEHGVDRPLLLLATQEFPGRAEIDRSWAQMLAHPGGRTRRREIPRAAHWVFTDLAAIAPQLQAVGLMPGTNRIELVGPIEPVRSVPLVRKHIRSFFSRHLCAGAQSR